MRLLLTTVWSVMIRNEKIILKETAHLIIRDRRYRSFSFMITLVISLTIIVIGIRINHCWLDKLLIVQIHIFALIVINGITLRSKATKALELLSTSIWNLRVGWKIIVCGVKSLLVKCHCITLKFEWCRDWINKSYQLRTRWTSCFFIT